MTITETTDQLIARLKAENANLRARVTDLTPGIEEYLREELIDQLRRTREYHDVTQVIVPMDEGPYPQTVDIDLNPHGYTLEARLNLNLDDCFGSRLAYDVTFRVC